MKLPDQNVYRRELVDGGAVLPLAKVPSPAGGLLSELPAPPAGRTGWPWTVETPAARYDEHPEWPKVTIVTPSYNQGAFLEQTIRSVLLQNYPDLEYLVIDGGSDDESLRILEKYAAWLSFRRSAKDRGQAHAINIGFSLASGQVLAWINSDDYYLPNALYSVASAFRSSGADFVYGYGYSYHTNSGQVELIRVLPYSDFFLQIPTIVQPSTFWTARIHQPVWESLNCAIDFELWMRMTRHQKKKRLRIPLSAANVHELAKTSDPQMKRKWDADEKLMWSAEGHGPVPYWHWVNRLNNVRRKIYRFLDWL